MLGGLFLIAVFAIGYAVLSLPALRAHVLERGDLAVIIPASFVTGCVFVTWPVYFTSYLLHVYGGSEHPIGMAFGIVAVGYFVLFALIYVILRKDIFHFYRKQFGLRDIALTVFYSGIFLFIWWTMYRSFHITKGTIWIGANVWSDFAPHTAMIRSFSYGANFPTQYPHYGGEDVKYHFMFQFLIGVLEYLGMRMDIAFNLMSTLSFIGFIMVLGSIAENMTHRRAPRYLIPALVFFRSGIACFIYSWQHLQEGDFIKSVKNQGDFIGYTPNENWGLWQYNVFLNQRHLCFGLLVMALVIWMFLPLLQEGCRIEGRGFRWFGSLFSRIDDWIPDQNVPGLFAGILLGGCAFWNGACTIGGLLILFGMMLFSTHKLDYAVTAVTALLLSFLQTRFFTDGGTGAIRFQWGFIVPNPSIGNVMNFIFEISGITILGTFFLAFFSRREERAYMVACLLPVLFAFTISMTPDITVNHKYIMMGCLFLSVPWSIAVTDLFSNEKKTGNKVLAVLLTFVLTINGFCDFVVVARKSLTDDREYTYDANSATTRWFRDNVKQTELVLTPEDAMSDVTLAGIMQYEGWPYYAWSAGYDTQGRSRYTIGIYSTKNSTELQRLVKEAGISYIVWHEGTVSIEEIPVAADTIRATYPLVYSSEDGFTQIYKCN